eukprot:jgi/Picsp_1/3080/NSC_01302-R1_---NA---
MPNSTTAKVVRTRVDRCNFIETCPTHEMATRDPGPGKTPTLANVSSEMRRDLSSGGDDRLDDSRSCTIVDDRQVHGQD